MKQLHNIKRMDMSSNEIILEALDKIINIIKEKKISESSNNQTIAYPSICMLLGESMDLLNNDVDWLDIVHQYMIEIKSTIENSIHLMGGSLFGGLADFGFGVYALNKATSHYDKFIKTLNTVIIDTTFQMLNSKNHLADLSMSIYDTISGFSGIAAYLLLYQDDIKVKDCIKRILEFFVLMTSTVEVHNQKVPNYYISAKNQFLKEEQIIYSKGNFNFGLSHGITGPLAILTIALNDGIIVEGQKEAIELILSVLKTFKYIDEENNIYWPGKISFEDFVHENIQPQKNRASWCYGTPGIARAMYMAGKAVNDHESINIATKAIDGLCTMKDEEWGLNSPTICHGYGGLLAVINAMYIDTGKHNYKECRDRLVKRVLDFYTRDSPFGFYNIDVDNPINNKYQMIEKNDISFLEGAIGTMLVLLSIIKPTKTNWMRHLLIQ